MLLSKQEGGNPKIKKRGGARSGTTSGVKSKGCNCVSKFENYSVFCFFLSVCVLVQKHYKNWGFSQFGAFF